MQYRDTRVLDLLGILTFSIEPSSMESNIIALPLTPLFRGVLVRCPLSVKRPTPVVPRRLTVRIQNLNFVSTLYINAAVSTPFPFDVRGQLWKLEFDM
ncbi:MAG: hypothetical protein ACYS32_18605, partial [Planctomycetota bacterium]